MPKFYGLFRTAVVLFAVGGPLAAAGCSSCSGASTTQEPQKTDAAAQSSADAGQKEKLVKTDGLPTLAPNAKLLDAAIFAWTQFVVLNQRAGKAGSKDIKRGQPDGSHTLGVSDDVLVWQTYAHRTELRPNGKLTATWDNLPVPPNYQNAYRVPLVQGDGNPTLNLWNNLDEDSEIDSCQLFGKYKEQPGSQGQKSLVLFEAKVNQEEYEYILNQYPDQHIGNTGDQADPTKCSEDPKATGHGPLCSAQLSARNQIKKGAPYVYYPDGPTNTCNCDLTKPAICLPCGTAFNDGSIEIKAAWRKLLSSDDPKRYYTSNVRWIRRPKAPRRVRTVKPRRR